MPLLSPYFRNESLTTMPQRGAAKWKLKRQLPRVNQNETWNEKLRNNNKKKGGRGRREGKGRAENIKWNRMFSQRDFQGAVGLSHSRIREETLCLLIPFQAVELFFPGDAFSQRSLNSFSLFISYSRMKPLTRFFLPFFYSIVGKCESNFRNRNNISRENGDYR